MPTEFTHIFISTILGKAGFKGPLPARFWVLAAVCSVLPDLDVVGYYLGVRYSDLFGHRGFFHSLTFALLIGVLVVVLFFPAVKRFSKQWWGMIVFFFIVIASHGLLDSMTDKGMGVGFFIPFDNTRYFLPWRPIFASPMSIPRFFSRNGFEVIINEVIWIWVPLIALYLALWIYRKKRRPEE